MRQAVAAAPLLPEELVVLVLEEMAQQALAQQMLL
jgi:hypothetical protein